MPLGSEFLVVAVHLPSKLHKKTEDQVLAATRLARQIQDAEERVGHTRTVLIGDLNMNPFEVGMVGSEGLHAVSDRRVVEAVERVVQEERRMFFYNPMWGALGDADNTPPGTYFYNSGTEVNFFWNAFDQVLIRPSLLPFFRRVTVIQAINGMSLLTDSGRPNQAAHSDHLPILADLSAIEDSANVY